MEAVVGCGDAAAALLQVRAVPAAGESARAALGALRGVRLRGGLPGCGECERGREEARGESLHAHGAGAPRQRFAAWFEGPTSAAPVEAEGEGGDDDRDHEEHAILAPLRTLEA